MEDNKAISIDNILGAMKEYIKNNDLKDLERLGYELGDMPEQTKDLIIERMKIRAEGLKQQYGDAIEFTREMDIDINNQIQQELDELTDKEQEKSAKDHEVMNDNKKGLSDLDGKENKNKGFFAKLADKCRDVLGKGFTPKGEAVRDTYVLNEDENIYAKTGEEISDEIEDSREETIDKLGSIENSPAKSRQQNFRDMLKEPLSKTDLESESKLGPDLRNPDNRGRGSEREDDELIRTR